MNENTNKNLVSNSKGTERTKGTAVDSHGISRFPHEISKGNQENHDQANTPLNTNTTPRELPEPIINRPEFRTHDHMFQIRGCEYCPGLYWHAWAKSKNDTEHEPVDQWICTPIHADAITANERNESFGLLLRFVNPNGHWREWAAPMQLLKGNAEALRGELLNMGVRIDPKYRGLLTQWMMESYPKTRIIAALRTGWHAESFVLPQRTIGASNIIFQSEHAAHNDFVTAGTLTGWQNDVAAYCKGNPLLLLAVSAAFAGPLLARAKLQETGGAGIHMVGDSSQGKTTALQTAGSVWGTPGFVRTWRATSNGLEATAAALNDTLLILDEISECDPREIGAIVYALANGVGKQRATRVGSARESSRWRVMALSSGERSLAAHMSEGGKRAKAGQEARLLDIPATTRVYGLFDVLHEHADGRSLADALKQATSKNFGHAGPAFVEALVDDKRDLPALYAKFCNMPGFTVRDSLEGRAASVFALLGFAGELATEYNITGWDRGEALKAALLSFQLWCGFRGTGQTETRQILQAIRNFILCNGDARFSSTDDKTPVRDRAGYWRDSFEGRIYLFNSPALQEASSGYDIRRTLDALETADWIVEHDNGRRSKKVSISGLSVNLYAIRPDDTSDL